MKKIMKKRKTAGMSVLKYGVLFLLLSVLTFAGGNPIKAEASGNDTLQIKQGSTTCSTKEEAAVQLRAAMKRRENPMVIQYSGTWTDPGKLTQEVLDAALAHTGVPDEGDYIRYQCHNISGNYRIQGDSLILTYSAIWYSTLEQEKEVDRIVKELKKGWNMDRKNEYEKALMIYDWICSNLTYDNVNMGNPFQLSQYTAYTGFTAHTGVCRTFSLVYYRLALESGLDCRHIVGLVGSDHHEWNIVRVYGKYYNLDTTFDLWEHKNITNYGWLLLGDKGAMRGNEYAPPHYPGEEYSTKAFTEKYPIAKNNFNPEKDIPACVKGKEAHSYEQGICKKCGAVLKSLTTPKWRSLTNVKSGIRLEWKAADNAAEYVIYRKAEGETAYKKVKTTTLLRWTDKKTVKGKVYKYKFLAKNGTVKSKASSVKKLKKK